MSPRLAVCRRPWLARMSSMLSGNSGAPTCVLAILNQHNDFLLNLDDSVYTFHSSIVGGSVGQHTRHSLDHLRKPLELLAAQKQGQDDDLVRYDIRDRHTPVERDRHAAIEQIAQLEKLARALTDRDVARSVHVAFMLSADGHEFQFESSFSREMAFAVHHCIHHNALSKVLLRHHFPELSKSGWTSTDIGTSKECNSLMDIFRFTSEQARHKADKNNKMASAKETVEAQITASPVVVYSKSYCPYCTKTKTLLTQLGAKFEVVELDQVAGGSEQQDALETITGQSTVPNVFVSGKSIGGNSDVQKLHKAGNLEPLLEQNGALA
ncbi:hypothetical protein BBJ29_000168 [Phytophthora kernoviae]|uniref:Glutaredoxin domain-containing protein n=1 Tax=Phytophthora kernoviae TaxID=325452 RepID=A0A3F2S4S7_9STRA|nr:hypothetical protein BBJ29_000168 [Phytophthora kernoviae]RLN69480.1 hypothetical protein BBP00_00000361 [Phytophthora kernoviae]